MDIKALDISMKQRNGLINSNYSIILSGSQILLLSIYPAASQREIT